VSGESPEQKNEDTRERRLARNEVFFREANELLERDAKQSGRDLKVICECSTVGCLERIGLSVSEYEYARSRSTWFIVTPGHENASVEEIVEPHPTYVLVEKIGVAGAVARRENPR
jgi:hypothetical protein